MARFSIDSRSPLPVYRQLCRAVKLEILAGILTDGDQLPSIRDLARLLKINPNTVAKAYTALEKEGLVEGKMGSGSRVRLKKAGFDSLRRALLEDEFKGFVERALSLGATKKDIKDLMERYLNNEPKDR